MDVLIILLRAGRAGRESSLFKVAAGGVPDMARAKKENRRHEAFFEFFPPSAATAAAAARPARNPVVGSATTDASAVSQATCVRGPSAAFPPLRCLRRAAPQLQIRGAPGRPWVARRQARRRQGPRRRAPPWAWRRARRRTAATKSPRRRVRTPPRATSRPSGARASIGSTTRRRARPGTRRTQPTRRPAPRARGRATTPAWD